MIKRYTKEDLPLFEERVARIRKHLDTCNKEYEKCIEPYKGSAVAYPFHRMFPSQIAAKNEAFHHFMEAVSILNELQKNDEVLLEHFEQQILGL